MVEGAEPVVEQPAGLFSNILSMISRLLIFYMIYNLFFGRSSSVPGTQVPTVTMDGKVVPFAQPHSCLFPTSQRMYLDVYLTKDLNFDVESAGAPYWTQDGLYFDGREGQTRISDFNITETHLPEHWKTLTNNGSLYIHAFLVKHGLSYNPKDGAKFNPLGFVHIVKQLNKHKIIKEKKRKNLLHDDVSAVEEKIDYNTVKWGSYWHKDVYLTLVDFHETFPAGAIPSHMLPSMVFDSKNVSYYPVFYVNDFWSISEYSILLNETVKEIPVHMEFYVMGFFKWQLYTQMSTSFSMQKSFGSVGDGDEDEMKRMILETNPYLLATTMIVSLLHSIFDFLAFKNDIQFWKERKSMEGISIRTLFINFGMQIVIFLYLADNETSWLILISNFVGLAIEGWKISKSVTFVRIPTFPYVSYEDKESYTDTKTKEYDDQAITYLSYLMYPCVIGYAAYSLYYHEHKGWYSFILNTLVGFIYMFGFIMLTPQLFINYKLKSVAHLPWRAFIYKALNTFIDDLFAFVIKMPTLHRLSVFRDDLIFFIYLYQRWIYRVDMKRVNEFGQEFETDDKKDEKTPDTPKPIEGKEKIE